MAASLTENLERLLQAGIKAGASDWHLDEGKKPAWRIEGRLSILGDAGTLRAFKPAIESNSIAVWTRLFGIPCVSATNF